MSPDTARDPKDNRRLRLGMVGGGPGGFIGAVHRIAARIDDRFELVAAALSSDPARLDAPGPSICTSRRIGPTAASPKWLPRRRAEKTGSTRFR